VERHHAPLSPTPARRRVSEQAERGRCLGQPPRWIRRCYARSRGSRTPIIKGDAAGEIAPPADGRWTEELREKYADRVEAILASHIDNFHDGVMARKAYSPADLEALNVNLVGGDPYGGFCGIDQFFLWRPFRGSVNHRTPVARLHHIGA
jgi:phytoene dehydrogenase-like protein